MRYCKAPCSVSKKNCFIGIFLLFISQISIYSHGTKYEIIRNNTIGVKAMYSNGDPMTAAKVLIFPPQSIQATDLTYTDSLGTFYVTPNKPGLWAFQVRTLSGHGMRINLEIDASLSPINGAENSVPGNFQKVVMTISILWGFIGTALYFYRRKKG